jgi:hypothetical protein
VSVVLYIQPIYRVLLIVVVVGRVTPIALNTLFHVIALAEPLSFNLIINFCPSYNVPVGAATVSAAACAVITAVSYNAALTVNVAELVYENTTGFLVTGVLINAHSIYQINGLAVDVTVSRATAKTPTSPYAAFTTTPFSVIDLVEKFKNIIKED